MLAALTTTLAVSAATTATAPTALASAGVSGAVTTAPAVAGQQDPPATGPGAEPQQDPPPAGDEPQQEPADAGAGDEPQQEPADAAHDAPVTGAQPASPCTRTAAATHGWGEPDRHSAFDGTTVPPDWHPYGPEPGHNKKGTRTPEQVSVADGAMTIRGEQDGTTGAVSWHPGQKYGRWEACVQSEKASGGLNALLLLWPVAEDFPVGGEVDWMEILSDDRQETSFFLHYGPDNDQDYGSVQHDSTQWSAYALEWTPEKITAYVDGEEWYTNTETDQFPPRPMNMTMQLDYFGDAGGPTAMHMDWASQWALPESEPAQLSLPPGAPATGQPKDYPERAPRELTPAEQQAPEQPAPRP
ncbi:Beta-glucanase, GH16 family [Pseudonocardia ammonioxydans]|uniref:Beta-glucanase, GH16 family n=1 Tax=Pseudonocardia ammonioxydans TaxID=260086 RepID=A0A1I5BS41_PSUAM|nr:Beta-glucanase, GH16 family [Pseudonocardia ammonioxydans]